MEGDIKYKARIKMLVESEGQRYIDDVNEEFRRLLNSMAPRILSHRPN